MATKEEKLKDLKAELYDSSKAAMDFKRTETERIEHETREMLRLTQDIQKKINILEGEIAEEKLAERMAQAKDSAKS